MPLALYGRPTARTTDLTSPQVPGAATVDRRARTEPDRRGRRRTSRRWSLTRVAVVVVATIGAMTLLYPTAASWFSARTHATQVSGYVSDVAALPAREVSAMLDDARLYNTELPRGPLRDPYALTASGEAVAVGGGRTVYRRMLDVDGGGMMGVIRIPSIGVDLPVFHDTDSETLSRGVGHLFGSSLPVGGEGTHAVLTGHSGVAESVLFSHLHELEIGDTMQIVVLGETLTYEVDQILTVDPADTQALTPVPGEDHITLVTCTPIGVNSHRLLVRGARVPTPAAAQGPDAFAANAIHPGFPWWAVLAAAAPALACVLTHPRGSARRHNGVAGPRDSTTSGRRQVRSPLEDVPELGVGQQFAVPSLRGRVRYVVEDVRVEDAGSTPGQRVRVTTCASENVPRGHRLVVRTVDVPSEADRVDASPWWPLALEDSMSAPPASGRDGNVIPLRPAGPSAPGA